ncbi:MAG TPA: hypothetical protein VIW45_09150 [Vicinamibacterales bacterium]
MAASVWTAVMVCLGCAGGGGGSSSSSTAPSSSGGGATPAAIAGTWTGTATDSTGPGTVTWTITQNGSAFTGTVTLADSGTSAKGRGTVSGTINGSSISFTMTIPAGGFDPPFASCTANISGTALAIAPSDGAPPTSIAATYSGSGSCSGAINGGQFTLTKS